MCHPENTKIAIFFCELKSWHPMFVGTRADKSVYRQKYTPSHLFHAVAAVIVVYFLFFSLFFLCTHSNALFSSVKQHNDFIYLFIFIFCLDAYKCLDGMAGI